MVPNVDDIQFRLLESISRVLPPSVNLADELCSVLQISMDSAYRRIKGVTPFSIREIALLCSMYGISFDSLCNYSGNMVSFDFMPMADEKNFNSFLLSIMHDLDILCRKKGTAVYAGEDIPIFHNFGFTALAKFKIFYWMKSVMNISSMQGVKFNSNLVSDETVAAGKKLYDLYARIPSVEIWTEITPLSLFKQIEFYCDLGYFQSKEDAMAVYDDVKEEFLLLEKAAENGCKFDSDRNPVHGENNYRLYVSDIEIGNNCILTDIDGQKTAYLACNTFNKIVTRDQRFCGDTDKWLKNLIRKSNLISDISEKHRTRFFQKLHDSLDSLRKKIEG